MANQPIRMSALRQILQQKSQGISNKQITRNLGLSRNTVLKYIRWVDRLEKSYEELLGLSEEQLSDLLQGNKEANPEDRLGILQSRFPHIEKELKRVGVTRHLLWQAYKSVHPDGYNYSRFCYYLKQWQQSKGAVMHFEHKVGEKLYVDYAGKKLSYTDWVSGKEKEVEVFVAVLGASQYTYVEASDTQKSEDFIATLTHSLEYFGGVPEALVFDNMKTAVSKSSSYEPSLNRTFEDFANHYGVALLATRPGKPRDKSLVENAVRQVYTQIYAPLRDQTFPSLAALNKAIHGLLPVYNDRHFQGRNHSRKDLYSQLEKELLKPLPVQTFIIRHTVRVQVQKNSHIHLGEDKHYYSVPYRYIGQRVRVYYTRDQVEVYLERQRIALHLRDRKPYTYTTIAEHLPSHHRFVSEWSPEKFIKWGTDQGESIKQIIEGILERRAHPEQAYKSCMGILNLTRKMGKQRVNLACKRSIAFNSYSYQTVKNILSKGLEEEPLDAGEKEKQSHIPDHDNIRGQSYYQ